MSKIIRKYDKLAYGKPKEIKGAGKLVNKGANIGVKLVQITSLRPTRYGYKVATKK